MRLLDVNVLVYAFRIDAPRHEEYRSWLERTANAEEPFGITDSVLSGFLRVVTHPRIFRPPTPLPQALEFVEALRVLPSSVIVVPGERHWEIFTRLCKTVGARGNLIPDAWFAALAIESGCEWVTTDRGYAQFPGLRFRHPLESV